MFHHRIARDTPSSVLFHWSLLAFLAGNVNAGGFLACGRFVSHMTGFFTIFGVDTAQLTWDQAVGILSMPFYFVIGVVLSAYLTERPLHQGRRPRYALVMAAVAFCLFLAALLGRLNLFGEWGELRLRADYFLLLLLCIASGLQNGAISVASGHTVRTTHMTGNTTDLGIGLVRSWAMPKESAAYADERRAVRMRGGIIAAFALGSAAGGVLFFKFRYLGFLLPAVIALYCALMEGFTDGALRRSASAQKRFGIS